MLRFVCFSIIILLIFPFSAGFADGTDCGDVDRTGNIDIDDVVYLINYLYNGGPAPCLGEDPSGELLDYEGCKYGEGMAATDTLSSNLDCMTWSYDPSGKLTFSHLNTTFNCCPTEIYGDIVIDGDQITVTETELEALCYCLCLFDLHFQITDLAPGTYTFTFLSDYAPNGDYLIYTVDLTEEPIGYYCVDRTGYYPWGPY